MKKHLIYFLLLILLIALLSGSLFRPNGKITVDNTKRTYTIHLPNGYPTGKNLYPVLFLFHGNPSKGWQMKLYTGMNKTADKNNFIVVYPDALDKRWSYSDCKKVGEDIRFINSLLKKLKGKYKIDTSRIYFSGMSGGAFFLSVLASAFPEKIAAMSIVAGNTIDPHYICGQRKSKVPIPLLLIHGTSDGLYYGREGILSADQTIEFWIKLNRCDTIPIIKNIPDINKKDNSSVLKIQYLSKIDKDVMFYKIENGGHHWPNSKFNANHFVKTDLGILNKDFNTNQTIWDFVSSYKTPATKK